MNADEGIKVWVVDGPAFMRAGLRALLHARTGRRLARKIVSSRAVLRTRLPHAEVRPNLAVVRRAETAPEGDPPDAA